MFKVGRFTVVRTFRRRVGRRLPWFVKVSDETGRFQVMRAYQLVQQEITGRAKATLKRAFPRLYAIHRAIIRRCYYWWSHDARWYHRRGIRVCPQWLRSFDSFARYVLSLGYRPGSGLSIDRIDNKLGYQWGNLRLATPKQQAENRRRPRRRRRQVA